MPDSTCRWPDCENAANTRGFCHRDYMRARRLGDFIAPWSTFSPATQWDPICRWPGCDRPSRTLGLCERDEQRARGASNMEAPWLEWEASRPARVSHCRWPGCGRKVLGRELCGRDYQRALSVEDFDQPWVVWARPTPCAYCGSAVERSKRYKGRYCSRQCSVNGWRAANPDKHHAANAKRRAATLAAAVDSFTRADLRTRDGDICYLCSGFLDFELEHPHPFSPSLDHVVPLILGGAHIMSNSAMTHLSCNVKKGRKTLEQMGIPMPRFTKDDLTIETAVPREAAELRSQGWREAKAKTAAVKEADAAQTPSK